MKRMLPLCLALAACGGPVKESSDAELANQAESLERAANATTDQMIRDLEARSRAESPAPAAPGKR